MSHLHTLSFCSPLSAYSAALGYNGINSTIDAVRGKHDAVGSMAAGALTGALFKSTGGRFSFSVRTHLMFAFLHSWCETCVGSSYYSISVRGCLELDKDTRLSTLYPM
jgi:Tim17/Tim22/Tim23/Pmp24 family